MDTKVESHKILIEITPEHWDHLSKEDVEQWVLYALLEAKNSPRTEYVEGAGGHSVAKIKRVRMPESKVGKRVLQLEQYIIESRARAINDLVWSFQQRLTEVL